MKYTNIEAAADVEESKKVFEKFNLQMFADDPDEESEDGGFTGEDDEEDSEDDSDSDDDHSDDDSDEDLNDDDGGDKKTKAIIKYKKQAKEAAKRAEEAERKLLEKESAEFIDKEVEKLVSQGHSKESATELATLREEVNRFKSNSLNSEIKALNADYPGADQFANDIKSLKMGALSEFTIEEIFLAKFYKKMGHDLRTDAEQLALHNAQKARAKAKADGEPPSGSGASVKLSKQQESVYKEVLKSHPTMTRKQFLALEDESAEIEG